MRRGSRTLACLQLLPVAALCLDTYPGGITKHVGMTSHQLIVNRSRDAREIEQALFLGHSRVKYNLKQQIAQLVAQLPRIIAIDCVRNFVGFFDRVGSDSREGLLTIPGATAAGIA